MKHPIKIIHKYKNNNRRVQYNIYIYIGKQLPTSIMNILEYIANKDFYSVLSNIKKSDYNDLEEYYGKYWYNYFFTSYHINAQKKTIINTKSKMNTLIDKYKKEWYNEHIETEYIKNSPYSFASEYYDYLLTRNKIKNVNRKSEIDYRTYNINTNANKIQDGGNDTDSEYEEDDINLEEENDDVDDVEITNEQVDENIENELDLNDIEKLYQTVDIESNKMNEDTTKLISEAINNKSWVVNTTKEIKYNDKYDALVYDSNIEDIYDKNYITEQYIYNDDSIKTIRNKICMSIPFSDKSIKILPECMYLWSEYNYNNKKEYIMLGQKWVTRTELLKIDIKPNDNSKIYEKLRNNLSYLKDNIGHKIKREDDEEKVLNFYDNYMTMNEIFMLDIYNEIGINYNISAEDKKNFFTVYVNIYYPLISFERFEQIIEFMTGNKTKEITFVDITSKTIMNDNKLLTEIENTVEKIKNKSQSYKKLFADNYIIQSNIHINLQDPKNITGTNLETKFNLYRIFDNFIVTEKYPFIQYQTHDGQIVYKINNNIDVDNENTKHELYKKWFENAPYGLSFKIDITENKSNNKEKYLSITLHDTGRIEYKITWTEEDNATMDDIKKTYINIRELLNKINSENKKIKIILPSDEKFKYAFINTIQKFTLPEKFKINHNDLSECCRYLFPYIALVIEPKKRVAKVQSIDKTVSDTISKYGTYIRYKRISDYDNIRKMQMRILYYLKYFDLSDNELINEISKQFNVTNEFTAKEIDNVKKKYGKFIKKSPSMQKKIKSLPRSKPPGIGIDIQGRDRDKYKIRITGARNKEQLDDIIDLMRVLIFLYSEIYLYKNKDYLKLKDTLNLLTNIAKRRNKVAEVVYSDDNVKTVRTITSLDKSRLGFRPEKGQHQWTRSCQNSGKDNKRRPDIIPEDQIDKLLKDGYKMNSKTGFYEKNVELKLQGKMVKTTLKAVKLSGDNKANYFTCDPTQNKDHVYIGFLSKSNNPNDLCMPCCFIKDQTRGDNKNKEDYFNKCLGDKPINENTDIKSIKTIGDKIYILQETNKIQDGRYIYLPKYLDIFFNKIWKNDHKIKNHYLLESKSGYFFKYTVKNDKYFFLAAIANIYDKTINELIKNMIDFIDKDKNDIYFTYLNNGSTKTLFQNRDNYIKYLKSSLHLEYDIIGELIALPYVISKKGIIYYIINKKTIIEKKILDKDTIKEEYYIDCLNSENNNTLNDDKDIIILIKDDKYYFPIYFIKKGETKKNKFIIQKIFENNSSNTIINNVINELLKYFRISCSNAVMNQLVINNNLVAKNIIHKLNYQKINVFKQFIDERNKCKYIELDNGIFLPVKPSGISHDYSVANIKNINIKYDLIDTIKKLEAIDKILLLDYKPKIILYDKKLNSGAIVANAISLENDLIINIKPTNILEKKIINMGLTSKFYSNTDIIDKEILINNNDDNNNHKDNVKLRNYMSESYYLYRLELSLYLSKHPKIKENIITLVRSDKIIKLDKKFELKKILLSIINKKLSTDYKVDDNMAFIVNTIPNIKDYVLHNIRDYCKINTTEKKCSNNLHCLWKNDMCKFQLLDSMAFDFVNKVIEEMIQNSIKFKELIEEGEYYVSDIIKQDEYTNRSGQQIIKASNYNINKVLTELFENDKIPILGKRKIKIIDNTDNDDKELIIIGDKAIQEIMPNADSIIRAYANSYYWVNNKLYDNQSRNLGYFSDLQTKLTYLLKANIIEYMHNNIININSANESFFNSSLNKFRKLGVNTDGKMELSVLSKIINIPIIVYDNYYNVKYIYNNGDIIFKPENFQKFLSNKNNIFIKFDFDGSTTIPNRVSSIYFL
jgi:hypothetical protein